MADNTALENDGLNGCSREEDYVYPSDPLIRERLEWFQDQKLALMMHWGLYAQLGICESWPLSDGDASWSRAGLDWEPDGDKFREQYFGLYRSFNPVRLEPEKWAAFAQECGFKYFLFTTRHMDGFCLFDTKYTDFKSTSPECAFHTHKYANIVKALFDAMRARGLGISAYYCKPDFHCPWYWAEGMDLPVGHSRNANYSPAEHPEIWDKFVSYVHNQVMELVSEYGKLDIMWLDGGQVSPENGQDARIGELARKARALQPWLLVADRMMGGEYENFITPEQSIPTRPIFVPWETCVTLGDGWGFYFDDDYKSARQVISMLIDVVCRGGNLALNIGPQPDGRLPARAMAILKQMGEWLEVNGRAIYNTRMCAPYIIGNTGFTKRADERFALIKLNEGERLLETIDIPWREAATPKLMDGTPLVCRTVEAGLRLTLPERLRLTSPLALAIQLV